MSAHLKVFRCGPRRDVAGREVAAGVDKPRKEEAAGGLDQAYPSRLTGVDLFSDPVPRHQFIDVGHFVICDTRQNPTQLRLGIDTVHAAGLNEGIGNGSSVTAALENEISINFL